MENNTKKIRSVAIVGAGAAGAVTAAAFKAENYYERIRVYERRETAGGTWIFDANPWPPIQVQPGKLPPDTDPPLQIPTELPQTSPPNTQERYSKTPVYSSLTTNVPDIAMSFSDSSFAYGPFPPHWVPRQYIENYFSEHHTDGDLVLNTTVEDISQILDAGDNGTGSARAESSGPLLPRWKLTLRRYDPYRKVDDWWAEEFDAVILANGHYSVPYVPHVQGLDAYIEKYPGRIVHSKYYRSPDEYSSKKVVVIGNSASGHDVSEELVTTAQLPVYQSRRSESRWDGNGPPPGIEWKPVIKEYRPEDGRIIFDDDSYLDDVDVVIYCTGYKPSFPFWNTQVNGRPLWDYQKNKLVNNYWHTFFHDFPTLAIVGLPRALTFRSFEYQGIALARLWSGRNARPLPPVAEQQAWEAHREQEARQSNTLFHQIDWDSGHTQEYLGRFYDIAGLATLDGDGRIPPPLTKELIWAIEHIRKYPDPDKKKKPAPGHNEGKTQHEEHSDAWVLVTSPPSIKDSLAFL